jgi:2-phosphosulfolactate phosphatase
LVDEIIQREQTMIIDAFLTPFFPEKENQFSDHIVVMIDVLRASTTICAALHGNAKEIIPCESLEKAVQIYGNLDRNIRFLGGERDCKKPEGFDAGNSPTEYTKETVEGKTVIINTSNGTKIFQKAKHAVYRIIGSFVNLDNVREYILDIINHPDIKIKGVTFLCAGNDGRLSYEDALCAGAFIRELIAKLDDAYLTDTAHVAKNLYSLHSVDMVTFLKSREHSERLIDLGFENDIDLAFTRNSYPVVPIISGNSIKRENIG